MDGTPDRSASASGDPLYLIGLRGGEVGRGTDLDAQRGSCEGRWRGSGLARAKLSADGEIAPYVQSQLQPRPGDPYPQPAWEESEVLSEFRASSRFIEVGFKKNVLQMIFPIFSDFKGSPQCGCLINGEIQLNLIMQ